MPKLKTLTIKHSSDYFQLIIDCLSLRNLKCLSAHPNIFLLLENSPLEILNLSHDYCSKKELGEKVFKKIITMNCLKEISFHMDDQWDNNILKTYGENYSVSKIRILWHHYFGKYRLIDFQKNFPNLCDLAIIQENEYCKSLGDNTVEIKENPNSKIKKISIDLNRKGYTINFNVQPFEKVEYIDLYSDIENINELPFFQPNNLRQFNSLKYFSFTFKESRDYVVHKTILENLYNNINNMPNLIEFRLSCLYHIEKDFYKKFVRKVLDLKSIKKIHIEYRRIQYLPIEYGEYYSKSDLKILYPDINLNNYYEIKIKIC